ncbi:DUF697 domain-containing protein [Fundicoccus culcitae]|uniref:YcjF family protein n=1 Tax=Fundicoccus culcitae TaxID=2969821 RepID=A0ABY5P897_9LACT|nr:DUF697 domain-containing protein [Fundicoccus culcitae]UUX34973.1 YcjF family protein [Fundicoccus culcitae]
MNNWWKDLRRILLWVSIIFGIIFTIFIINQFITLYQFLAAINSVFAIITVSALLIAITVIAYKLGRVLFSKPLVIELADNASNEEYQEYIKLLTEQLKTNPLLAEIEFKADDPHLEEKIEESFTLLNEKSLPLIKENANAIFLSTAISQNGSLDSFMVIFSNIRMIWQLANIYGTRPSLASLIKLYAQVGSIMLMARTMEDSDLIETQMEPLIASILGESIASAIPGMVPIANLVVSSMMEGSVNAFLTLRVGLVTQNYLSSYHRLNQQTLKRSTSMLALSYMGSIIRTNSKTVLKTVGNAAKKAGVGTAKRWFGFESKGKDAV